MPDVLALHAAILRTLTETPCIPVFRGTHLQAVEPLTHEEAAVLAPALTATVLNAIEGDQAA